MQRLFTTKTCNLQRLVHEIVEFACEIGSPADLDLEGMNAFVNAHFPSVHCAGEFSFLSISSVSTCQN